MVKSKLHNLASRLCAIHICHFPDRMSPCCLSLWKPYLLFCFSNDPGSLIIQRMKVPATQKGQLSCNWSLEESKTLTSFKSYVIGSDKFILSKVLRVPKFRDMVEFAQTCQICHLCLKVWHKVQF